MNKYEIETAILTEFAQFMPTIEHLPFDKALPKNTGCQTPGTKL